MESLRHLLKKKVAFVSSDEHDSNPPTDEQLASFLRNLTAETGLAIRGAPPGVSSSLKACFFYWRISVCSPNYELRIPCCLCMFVYVFIIVITLSPVDTGFCVSSVLFFGPVWTREGGGGVNRCNCVCCVVKDTRVIGEFQIPSE